MFSGAVSEPMHHVTDHLPRDGGFHEISDFDIVDTGVDLNLRQVDAMLGAQDS
jgi:hypothetical protein